MPRSGRDQDQTIGTDPAADAIEDRDALALDEDQDLVDPGMDLITDLAARRDTHHDDLCVRTRGQDLPEVRVALRAPDDVLVECHG